MHLNMSSAKVAAILSQPQCVGRIVLEYVKWMDEMYWWAGVPFTNMD